MWRALPACVLALSCDSNVRTIDAAPGRAEIWMEDWWMQGKPTEVSFQWRNASICNFDDWFCRWPEGMTTTVMAVTCRGCTVLDDPTGTTAWSMAQRKLTAVATTDGPISVDVALRFDATGDEKTVSATAVGDHEVALEAECRLIDVAGLSYGAAGPPEGQSTSASAMHACGATRLSTQAVGVFPQIRTYRGHLYFPYCFPDWPCTLGENARLRPLRELSMSPAPAGWGRIDTQPPVMYFAAYLTAVTGTIELSAPLLPGGTGTASVVIPSLP